MPKNRKDCPAPLARKRELPSWLIPFAGACLIVGATLLAYLPTLGAGFVYDDGILLIRNTLIKASDGLYRFWFTTEPYDYFPLFNTLLWFEWRLWGMNPTGYHVVNVLLHAASAVLLWRVIRLLGIPGAWLAALVFAIHPVNVESVAWITECKNLLAMVFQMLTLLFYLRFQHDGGRRWYALSIGAFALALLAKTAVVMLPVALLLCVWWLRGRLSRKDVRDSLPFFALAGALALVTIWFHSHRVIVSTVVRDDGFLSRLIGATWAIWFYLYKAILPYELCIVYPRWTISLSNPLSYIPALLLAGGLAVLWRYRAGWARPGCFAIGYYVVMLFPVLGFFNISFMYYSLVADRWQYFSLPGIIALAAGLCGYAYRRWSTTPRGSWWSVGAGVVCALCVLTWRQASVYTSEQTLWGYTLAKNPECFLAHNNLGNVLWTAGKADQAMVHYAAAFRSRPDNVATRRNLATALLTLGKTDQAIGHYTEILRSEPNDTQARFSLGLAFQQNGEADQATVQYVEVLRQEPNHAIAHRNLAVILLSRKNVDQAIPHLERASALRPDWPEPLGKLAWVWATWPDGRVRDGNKAVQAAMRACELTQYRRLDLLDALAAAFAEAGRYEDAARTARKTLELAMSSAQKTVDLATRSGQEAFAREVRARLELYESSRAFHESP